MSQADERRERDLLTATVEELLADHCPPSVVADAEGGWAGEVWRELAAVGLVAVGMPEESGGAGGSLRDAAAVLRAAAAHAAPVPLAEVLFPVAAVCGVAGLSLPAFPATVATGPRYVVRHGRVELEGVAARVPWARIAERILLVATPADAGGPELAGWLDTSGVRLAEAVNLAGEPRDDVLVSGAVLGDEVVEVAAGTAELVRSRGALARSVQIAGALGAVLDLTVRYAGERVQFGRPIGRFQAVAHLVSDLAGTAVAAEAAATAAVDTVAALAADPSAPSDGALVADAVAAVACAKSRTSSAAGPGARIAHQVHGAIGFTQEHRLHHLTRRLWSWREEYGSEEHWSGELGRLVIEAGADELWPLVTRV